MASCSGPGHQGDMPESRCPGCGVWLADFDGFGVLAHVKPAYADGCGYCSHPSRDGDGKGNWVCEHSSSPKEVMLD